MDEDEMRKEFEKTIPLNEIDNAKVYCMCGDHIDHHTFGSGHAPVSMYDHYFYCWQVDNGHIVHLDAEGPFDDK